VSVAGVPARASAPRIAKIIRFSPSLMVA